jgi:putative nucleotidyltransferase with HDIG domain
MWTAAVTFFRITQVPPLWVAPTPIGPLIPPLLCLTAIYFVINSGLTAVAVGTETGSSPVQVWQRHVQWLSVGYLASASVALCLVVVVQQVGLAAIAIVLPVLAVFHRTVRATFGRLEDAERHVEEVNRLYRSTIQTLAMAIDAKDDVTHSHVRRVQAYAAALAEAMEVTDQPTLRAIEAASLLHDAGKLAVPEHILNKPGKLTPSEFEQIKRHVDVGADILSLVDFPFPVVPIVRCHHENWDGTGYPRGVSGEAIPLGARILAVADCFDALTSDRPYRSRLSNDAALDILRQRSGAMYDPRVVDTFIRIYRHIPLRAARPEQTEILDQIRSRQVIEAPATDPIVRLAGDAPAFASVARLVDGGGTSGDVLAISSALVRSLVPDVSGAWFMVVAPGSRLVVADAFGVAAPVLRGLDLRVGERLSGWVAAHRQAIVNSDPVLDLGDVASTKGALLKSCLSVPLTSGDALVGVLTLYATTSDAFTDDLSRLMQMLGAQVAHALELVQRRSEQPELRAARELKLVSTR